MRILHVINLGTACGGAERLVAAVARQQRADGHDVLVLSSDLPGQGARFSDVRPARRWGKQWKAALGAGR